MPLHFPNKPNAPKILLKSVPITGIKLSEVKKALEVPATKANASIIRPQITVPRLSLSQILLDRAKIKAAELEAQKQSEQKEIREKLAIPEPENLPVIYEKDTLPQIELNAEQQRGIDLAISGQDTIVIGAAGTGKTTSLKGMIAGLLNNRSIPCLSDVSHTYLLPGAPGIIGCSYTRRSVSNMKKAIPQLASNIITIHKLLQFEPSFFEIIDPITQETRQTMRFVPGRHKLRPLDRNISIIVIDEAGTVPMELYNLLIEALPDPSAVQFIYLGDLDQNPPVFGAAVLGYKGLELMNSTVQLTHVYRQALESPIIRLAHRILSGVGIEQSEFPAWCFEGKLHIRAWQKRINDENAMNTIGNHFLPGMMKGNGYNPKTDMILMTQNVKFGTIELNKRIANYLAREEKRVTYEVISGFLKHYYSVGDTVLYEKEDAEIVKIEPNPNYQGIMPQCESETLDYWGYNSNYKQVHIDIDAHFEAIMNDKVGSQVEERKTDASHNIYIRRKSLDINEENEFDTEANTLMLNSAAELNALTLGYALTVHKAQGSEWRRVFIITHHSNAAMLSRELLYTAVTRAREELYIICEPESFVRGIEIQKIKGTSIKEKLEHFARKLEEKEITLESN